MKYCIIGSGGREHALSWRLLEDGSAKQVYVIPGNGGINDRYRVDLAVDDFGSIGRFCTEKLIDMVVVGPEAPLATGIVDHLREKKIPVFGPEKKAAMLEGSKLFAKKIMDKKAVPTANYVECASKKELTEHIKAIKEFPVVIKLDGLAAGKGVGVLSSEKEALAFIESMVKENTKVFIEDYIEGEEASVLGISDGKTILPLVPAQDHKRIHEGDKGPNTGGMGAYAPAPVIDSKRLEYVQRKILQPVIDAMREEGMPFVGVLYAGLICSGEDVKVLEFNVRFGDPEIQAILPILETKLGTIIEQAVIGDLSRTQVTFKNASCITVVMVSGGYPGSYEKGKIIHGLDSVPDDVVVFHAGTQHKENSYSTSGGRVLNVTSHAPSLREAREKVYKAIESIEFDGAYYRRDIGSRAL